MRYALICIIILLALASAAPAADHPVTCSGGPSSDISAALQSALTAATGTDTVTIGAGSCGVGSPVSWLNKNITVQAAGSGLTTINSINGNTIFVIGTALSPDGSTTTTSRGLTVYPNPWVLKGMTLTNSTENNNYLGLILFNSGDNPRDTPTIGWRITDVVVNVTANHPRDIYIYGITWGLIDHFHSYRTGGGISIATFSSTDEPGNTGEYYRGYALGGGLAFAGNRSWSLPLHPGSEEAIYVEDSSFDGYMSGTGGGMALCDIQGGTNIVVRHSTMLGAQFYSHTGEGGNTAGRGGMRWYEFYNNSMNGMNIAGLSAPYASQENGTGVIFNNQITGYGYGMNDNNVQLFTYRAYTNYTGTYYGTCQPGAFNGSAAHGTYDAFYESTGWPCLDQTGRILINGCSGQDCSLTTPQDNVPVLLWNNGPQAGCATGGACTESSGVETGQNCAGSCINLSTPASAYVRATAHTSMGGGNPGYGDLEYCASTNNTMPTVCGNRSTLYTTGYTYPHPPAGGGGSGAGSGQRKLDSKITNGSMR